jgi:hypothetical protein
MPGSGLPIVWAAATFSFVPGRHPQAACADRRRAEAGVGRMQWGGFLARPSPAYRPLPVTQIAASHCHRVMDQIGFEAPAIS